MVCLLLIPVGRRLNSVFVEMQLGSHCKTILWLKNPTQSRKDDNTMPDTRILLSALWVSVMLIYLLGDVLRIYSGDMLRMSEGQSSNGLKWMAAAVLMLIPILMVFLSLVLPQPIARWANILTAAGFLLFVLADLRSYPSAYDTFLFVVSLGFNILTVWYAWNWT
jgi:hypothetical protein